MRYQKMPVAYLHIGMPKTGTTSIQHALAKARPQLARHGLVYPGTAPDHADLMAEFHRAGPDHFVFRQRGWDAEKATAACAALLRDIDDLSRRPSRPDLILSSEFLINMRPRWARKLKRYFRDRGYRVRIVCYVRHPMSQISSEIQQGVKDGLHTLRDRRLNPRWHSARKALTPYIDVFGADAITVRDFRSCLSNGPARDILQTIGYAGPLDTLPDVHANRSLTAPALYIIDFLNQAPGGRHVLRRIRPGLHKLGGPKYRLSDRTRARIAAPAKEEVDWIEATFGVRLDG